jgi:hypothetical protein
MSKTIRNQPSGVSGLREKVRTRNERIGIIRCLEEANEAGYRLIDRQRPLRDRWDDIRVSAAREGRWFSR